MRARDGVQIDRNLLSDRDRKDVQLVNDGGNRHRLLGRDRKQRLFSDPVGRLRGRRRVAAAYAGRQANSAAAARTGCAARRVRRHGHFARPAARIRRRRGRGRRFGRRRRRGARIADHPHERAVSVKREQHQIARRDFGSRHRVPGRRIGVDRRGSRNRIGSRQTSVRSRQRRSVRIIRDGHGIHRDVQRQRPALIRGDLPRVVDVFRRHGVLRARRNKADDRRIAQDRRRLPVGHAVRNSGNNAVGRRKDHFILVQFKQRLQFRFVFAALTEQRGIFRGILRVGQADQNRARRNGSALIAIEPRNRAEILRDVQRAVDRKRSAAQDRPVFIRNEHAFADRIPLIGNGDRNGILRPVGNLAGNDRAVRQRDKQRVIRGEAVRRRNLHRHPSV